jgi:hypothetical protein
VPANGIAAAWPLICKHRYGFSYLVSLPARDLRLGLASISYDPNFSVAGECPNVSDSPSMGSGKAATAGSSSSDFAGRQPVRLRGL